jgi:hypothetical protein
MNPLLAEQLHQLVLLLSVYLVKDFTHVYIFEIPDSHCGVRTHLQRSLYLVSRSLIVLDVFLLVNCGFIFLDLSPCLLKTVHLIKFLMEFSALNPSNIIFR